MVWLCAVSLQGLRGDCSDMGDCHITSIISFARGAYNGATTCIMWGDALCAVVFLLAAIIQFLRLQRRAGSTSILFAIGITVGWFLLLPLCGLARA